MKLILDIETNGFLHVLDKIHCMVFRDIETQKVYSYNPDQINEGLNLLKKATLIIGHSVMGFDLPAIEKVTGYKYEGEILDTLLCSRLIWSNQTEIDYEKKEVPPKLIGKHSIESWGYRLGLRKGDFAQTATFDVWTQDMQIN
jgi:DNA polymerase-1